MAYGLCILLVHLPIVGSAQPFRETKLIAPDAAEFDQFGASVAIFGNWAAVGAPGRDERGENSGAVYIFRKSNGRWQFSQKLLAHDGAAGDGFATLAMEGEYLAVRGHSQHNGVRSGAVYIFKRIDTTWIQMRKIGPTPAVRDAFFGGSISLKGEYLLIGAELDREANTQTGAAYVFRKSGEDWVQEARLLASDRRERQWFGYTVSILDSLALVGAPYDSNKNGEFAGAAYLFQKSGSVWGEKAKLIPSGGRPEGFAGCVAMEAEHIVIGAPNTIVVSRPGVVYAFGPTLDQRQTVSARDGVDRNAFGVRLTVRRDCLIVKASGDTAQGVGSGAAYLFSFENSVWSQIHKFQASDGAAGANYGECAMFDSTVIIGSLNARVGGLRLAGSAYVYEPFVVDVHESVSLPSTVQLFQNYPNPFNASTKIRYQVAEVLGQRSEGNHISLKVFDVLGREVAILEKVVKQPGEHTVTFDASELSSGVYFYRIQSGAFTATRKMLVAK